MNLWRKTTCRNGMHRMHCSVCVSVLRLNHKHISFSFLFTLMGLFEVRFVECLNRVRIVCNKFGHQIKTMATMRVCANRTCTTDNKPKHKRRTTNKRMKKKKKTNAEVKNYVYRYATRENEWWHEKNNEKDESAASRPKRTMTLEMCKMTRGRREKKNVASVDNAGRVVREQP